MSLSNATAVHVVEWKELIPGPLDPSGTESAKDGDSRQETSDNAFQFAYGVPEEVNRNVEFIPFYGQSDSATAHGDGKIPVDDKESPEEILERSSAEGYAKGEKEGFEAGKQKAGPIVERMQGVLDEIDGLWQQLVQTYEEKIIQLVSRVSEKVVLGQVAVDHDTVKRVILDAFRMIPEPVEITIDIHPEDAEHIENIKEEFFHRLKTLKHISLLPDSSISPGGCRVKTRFGEVDATLESRLDVIQQTIMNVYRSKGGIGSDA
jgi:flagellar assembly protein FliH